VSVAGDPLTHEIFSPARQVDLAQACAVLRGWDDTGGVDARGALLWGQFWARASLLPADRLYAVAFDPADPVNTPRDLRPDAQAALRQAFGAAILAVEKSGLPLDAPRGAYLFATRGGERLGLYGGCPEPGYFTLACPERPVSADGYGMDGDPHGNSYLQVVAFPAGRVQALTLLAPSQSDDPQSPHFGDYTRRYAARQWLRVPFTEAEIAADPDTSSVTIGE
jgi:acyl-homoserine-lactone acylase